jgi:hypothetical protein
MGEGPGDAGITSRRLAAHDGEERLRLLEHMELARSRAGPGPLCRTCDSVEDQARGGSDSSSRRCREFEIRASRSARAQASRPIRLHQGERLQVPRCIAVKSPASRQRGPASADARPGCASTVTSMLLPDGALRPPEAKPHENVLAPADRQCVGVRRRALGSLSVNLFVRDALARRGPAAQRHDLHQLSICKPHRALPEGETIPPRGSPTRNPINYHSASSRRRISERNHPIISSISRCRS